MIILALQISGLGKDRKLVAINLDQMISAERFTGSANDWTVLSMDDGTYPLLDISFSDFISILRVKGNQHFYDARPKEAQDG